MKIEKRLPFDICDSCCECVLDVEEQTLFSFESACQKLVIVKCRNENLCRMLKEKHDADEK